MKATTRRRSRLTVASVAAFVCLALAFATGGFAAGFTHETADDVEPSGWFSDELDGAGERVARLVALSQAEHALKERARAISKGDVAAFDGLQFTKYEMRLPSTADPSFADLLAGRFSTSAVVNYELAGDNVLVGRTGTASFELGRRGWQLVDITVDERDLWSYGAVATERSGKSLVIGSESFADQLSALALQTESARADVESFWSAKWPGRVVVVLPAQAGWMDSLIGDDAASTFPAVATRDPGSDGAIIRVTVNPRVFYDLPYLGQQIILRHEITHVAQNGLVKNRAPVWLAEGLATYVSYRGSGVPQDLIGRVVFDEVRSVGPPEQLPSNSDFNFDSQGRDRAFAYEQGWAFCTMIAERYGEQKLVPFYVAVGKAKGSSNSRIDSAAKKVFDVSGDELVAQWQSWLSENA